MLVLSRLHRYKYGFTWAVWFECGMMGLLGRRGGGVGLVWVGGLGVRLGEVRVGQVWGVDTARVYLVVVS